MALFRSSIITGSWKDFFHRLFTKRDESSSHHPPRRTGIPVPSGPRKPAEPIGSPAVAPPRDLGAGTQLKYILLFSLMNLRNALEAQGQASQMSVTFVNEEVVVKPSGEKAKKRTMIRVIDITEVDETVDTAAHWEISYLVPSHPGIRTRSIMMPRSTTPEEQRHIRTLKRMAALQVTTNEALPASRISA
jgi:hypothetical protein